MQYPMGNIMPVFAKFFSTKETAYNKKIIH